MKLNIGCGRNVKEGFINCDIYEREVKLDKIFDVTKSFPFESDSCDYIYAEQFIEHLEWLDGLKFLRNCYTVLKSGGILRLVFPDYKMIFEKYLEGDISYFKVFFEGLNEGDLPYYSRVFQEPDKVRRERINNPPPNWHVSSRRRDRRRLDLRVRRYKHLIEIVDWFCHQYGEHKTLYDFECMKGILTEIGFRRIYETGIQEIDSHAPTRITSSLYMEAVK